MKHFFSLQRYLAFLCIIGFFLPVHAGLALRNIDQTYQILPPHLKHYSITHGAILWETGWVNNFYRFANFYPLETLDHLGRKKINVDPAKSGALIQFIYLLFHRIPGSTSYTDFDVTHHLHIQDPFKIAELVAKIVVKLDYLQAVVMEGIATHKELVAEVTLLLSDKELTNDPNIQQTLTDFLQVLAELRETKDLNAVINKSKEIWGRKEALKNIKFKALNDIVTKYTKTTQQLDIVVKPIKQLLQLNKISAHEFGNIMAHTLQECQPFTTNGYPTHFVHSLWLAFLWKTLENVCGTDEVKNRQAIQVYYAHLANLLKKELEGKKLNLPLEVTLPKNINSHKATEEFLALIEKTFLNDPNLPLDSAFFYAVKIRTFPQLQGYAQVAYQPPFSASGPVFFPDCMENSIANFIRTMSYDLERGIYSIDTLENRFRIILSQTARDRLAPFFKDVSDANVWAELVSNIAYAPYLSNISNKLGSRFIRIEDMNLTTAYEKAGYTVIDQHQAVYELHPSLRTIIIVLNHILDLDLFEGKLAQEALRPDFVTHYFSLLCKKLHLQGGYAKKLFTLKDFSESAEEEEEEQTKIINKGNIPVDIIDYNGDNSLFSIFLNKFADLENNRGLHQFTTNKWHGEYEFNYESNKDTLLDKINNLFRAAKKPQLSFWSNALMNMLYPNKLIWLSKMNTLNFNTIFVLPLYNPESAYKLAKAAHIDTILDHKYEMLFALAKMQPDPNRANSILNIVFKYAKISLPILNSLEKNLIEALKKGAIDYQFLLNLLERYEGMEVAHLLTQEELTKKYYDIFSTLLTDFTLSKNYVAIAPLLTYLYKKLTYKSKPWTDLSKEGEKTIQDLKNFLAIHLAYSTLSSLKKTIHLMRELYTSSSFFSDFLLSFLQQLAISEPSYFLLKAIKRFMRFNKMLLPADKNQLDTIIFLLETTLYKTKEQDEIIDYDEKERDIVIELED